MTKRKGTTNYSRQERQRLLESVAEILPVRRADWDSVAKHYNGFGDAEGRWQRDQFEKEVLRALYVCSSIPDPSAEDRRNDRASAPPEIQSQCASRFAQEGRNQALL